MAKGKGVTYKDAGVDIDAGEELVKRIKPIARRTRRRGTMGGGLGGFGALFDLNKAGKYKNPILVSSTDGVGTKLKIAQAMNKHDTIGIDLVAMCVNDLLAQGAEPLFFLDYFATGALKVDIAEQVIKGIADGCKLANCALIGGETAEMPGMYAPDEYDLAGFTVGVVEESRMLPKKGSIEKGDIVLGLASSGVHSNGFSLVRHIMKKHDLDFHSEFSPGQSFGEVLLTPTKIYVKSCLNAIRKYPKSIKALAHITGGGIVDNLPRVIPNHMMLDATGVKWGRLPIFNWLSSNVSVDEMQRTFNCGIGMVLVVSKSAVNKVTKALEDEGETVFLMGKMVVRSGIMPQVILGG